MSETKKPISILYDWELIFRAAILKTKSMPHIDVTDLSRCEENTDPKLKRGVWVNAWLFISENEIQSAEDTTP